MQVSEIKERFTHFEHCVEEAMQACQQDASVSPRLADTIKELDREVHQVHDMICNAQQESDDLVECIDHLEEMGDNAKRACQSASNLSQNTQDVVLDLHREISDLKHQLH
jgi:methyl-accepting chemotaxis protein